MTRNRCIPRHLGAAAALLGRPEEARNHYQEAIKVCTEMRFRPELALTRLQLAKLLVEHYPNEKSDALEHPLLYHQFMRLASQSILKCSELHRTSFCVTKEAGR